MLTVIHSAPNAVPVHSKPATAKPKPATNTAARSNNARGRGKRGGARGGRAGRAKPKTAEELDAEMADYWDGGAPAAAGGAADGAQYASVVAPEVAMDDDGVLVSCACVILTLLPVLACVPDSCAWYSVQVLKGSISISR